MPFLMVRGDIADMRTDAVVIPAAGTGQLRKASLVPCRAGKAVMRKRIGSVAPSINPLGIPAWNVCRHKR